MDEELFQSVGVHAAAARHFDVERLNDLIAGMNRMHTTAPIFDPTAYMRGMKTLDNNIRVAKAFRDFVKAVQEAGS